MASMFVYGGVNALKNAEGHAVKAKPIADQIRTTLSRISPQLKLPEDTVTLVRLNAGAQILAATALATGRAPRTASTVLAASLVPTTFAGHQFWDESDPETRAAQKIHFFKNVSMLGGLMLAAVDTEGRPGLAWRARHSAGEARRSARHLRREAKLQAKLAASQAGLT